MRSPSTYMLQSAYDLRNANAMTDTAGHAKRHPSDKQADGVRYPSANKPVKTAVVIENNPADMSLMSEILTEKQFRIMMADNSDTGLAMAENAAPEVIIVNLDLPGIEGLTLPQLLASRADIGPIPIIGLSEDRRPEAEQAAHDNGCAMYLTKPLDPAQVRDALSSLAPHQDDDQRRPSSSTVAKARVLIVDDELMNLKLFKAYLSTENYEIITAESGQEALRRVDQTPPDVILLDIMMPGMDGFEVTRRLKKNPATDAIPIIMVTALSGEKNRARGLEAGADEFLTKPVHKAELVARVGSMLRLKRFQDQLRSRQASENLLDTPSSSPQGFIEGEHIPSILIVEDDDRDAKLLRDHLEKEPYFVRRVSNGEIAIRDALDDPPDLIILDIMLPGIDGFEVCRRLKSDGRMKHTQLLMQTSLRELEYRIQGSEVGADDYLVKPVEPRELLARVQALLKKKRYIDKLNHRYESALNRAIRDGLTGLYNHEYFKRFLQFEINRSLQQRHLLSLLLIDLDNFKQVNDCLGHQTGDRILINVAKAIGESVRDVDFVARYGGEEFVVILPYADHEEAREIAECIRIAIKEAAQSEFTTPDELPVSASIGVACCPEDGTDVDLLIRKADEMMYLAKQLGKDQICFTSDY